MKSFLIAFLILICTSVGYAEEKQVEVEPKEHSHEITVVMPRSYYELVIINQQLIFLIEQLQQELADCQRSLISI